MDADAEKDFRAFVDHRSGALFRRAYLLTGDRHRAEDLVQSALAKAASKWTRLRRQDRAEAYVQRIIYNDYASWWRRRAKITELASSNVPDQPLAGAGHDHQTELKMIVHAALYRLTPRQRAVLVLRYLEDLSETECAQLLDISVGAVRSQNHRALARLREVAPELSPAMVSKEEQA